MVEWFAAGVLVFIGIVHSVLGEADILRPLFTSETLATKYPRWAVERLLRFAWHLTTLAWFALAAVMVGVPIELAFAAMCLASAAIILIMLPGHLAWPLFLMAGLFALWAGDALNETALWVAVGAAIVVAVVAAGFHVAWALGSRRGSANVLPQNPDSTSPMWTPPRWLTAVVAVALLGFAAVALAATQADAGPVRWLAFAALAILTARVFGEGRYVGVSKSVRSTGFSRADDKYWTPLVGVLALGAAAALTLGAFG